MAIANHKDAPGVVLLPPSGSGLKKKLTSRHSFEKKQTSIELKIKKNVNWNFGLIFINDLVLNKKDSIYFWFLFYKTGVNHFHE